MDEKIYLKNLDCYQRADEKQKSQVKDHHCFDLGQLPTEGLKVEFQTFIEERGRNQALATMSQERILYQRFCRALREKHIRADGLRDMELEKWMLKIRGWILENGQKLTLQGVSVYGKEKISPAALLTYFRKVYFFIEEEDQRDELEKDIWELDKLDILIRTNPIKNFQTLNFTAIIQKDLREEVKKSSV